MENILSLKFKLQLNKEQKSLLLSTIKKYNEAVNYILKDNFNEQSISQHYLHHKYYYYLRETYNFTSQMAINVSRESIQIYQLLKKQNKLNDIPKKKQLTINYTLNRNLTINTEHLHASFSVESLRFKK